MPSPLIVQLPENSIELLPVNRTHLMQLRQHFLDLHRLWLEKVFSIGEVVASDEGWETMRSIVSLLPRKENPAVTGFDLELLSNDYDQLGRLFFADCTAVTPDSLHNWATVSFDFNVYESCLILAAHGINHKTLLMDAETERQRQLTALTPTLESTDDP